MEYIDTLALLTAEGTISGMEGRDKLSHSGLAFTFP